MMRSACILVALVAAAPAAAATVVVSWPLDNSDGSFVADGTMGNWEWGEVATGPGSGYDTPTAWGTRLGAHYRHNAFDTLTLPSLDLTGVGRPVLTFWHWYDIDAGGDAAWLEVERAEGVWERLAPVYGYSIGESYTGTSAGWLPAWFDLTGVENSDAIRFVFQSNDKVARSGWFIDAVTIEDGDTVPPDIGVPDTMADTQDIVGPYVIDADIQDDTSTPTAEVVWWTDLDPTELAEPLVRIGPESWQGTLPAVAPDTQVYWRIEATDTSDNMATWPPTGASSFRVYLAAPVGLAGPDGRVVAVDAELDWSAPDSLYDVEGYRIYRGDALVAHVDEPPALVPLQGPVDSFTVSAVYDTPVGAMEGDRSEPVEVVASVPTVTRMEPTSGWQGDTLRVELVGRYLLFTQDDAWLDMGDGLTLESVEVLDVDTATFTMRIDPDADVGERQVVVHSGELALDLDETFEIRDGADLPSVLSVAPDAAGQGDALDLEILVDGLENADPLVDLGEGVFIEKVEVDGDRLFVSVVVANDAPLGMRDVAVDDGVRILTGATFRVRDASVPPTKGCSTARSSGALVGLWLAALGIAASRRRRSARRSATGRAVPQAPR